MIGFKDEFYSSLRNDFSGHATNSFLYKYLETEKNNNFRLQLKARYAKLKNTENDKKEYLLFVVTSLLENPKLQQLYGKLDSLKPFLHWAGLKVLPDENKKQKEQVKAALRSLQNKLQSERETTDFSLEQIENITKELLGQFTYTEWRKDVYVQLKEYFLDYETGNLSEAEYLIQLLEILMTNSRYHLSKNSHQMLLEYGMLLGGENLYVGVRKDKDKYEKIIEILKDSTSGEKLEVEKIKDITEELLSFILMIDVRSFLYDVGYPEKEDTETSVASARKKDRTMDMLDAYCRQNRISLKGQITGAFGSGNDEEFLSPEKKEMCKELYKQLQEGGNGRVLVPLAIDVCTGAGIYIVGKDYYKSIGSVYSKIKGNCCYSIIYYEDLNIDRDMGFSFTIDIEKYSNFPTLEEAEKWFKRQISMEIFLDGYREYNEEFPKDCPECFKIYFQDEMEQDEFDLVKEAEEMRKQLNKEFASLKK